MEPIYSRTIPPCNYIRTSDFSLIDLHIFVDSMETISRIERERKESRQRRRENKLKNSKHIAEFHSLPKANIIEYSSEEDLRIPVQQKPLRTKLFSSKTKTSPVASSDENYFSGASETSEGNIHQESITTGGINTQLSNASGTESENSIFKLRPRSSVMTSPKYRTTRARIIGLVLKREYANGGSQEELEKQERRERVLESLMKKKTNCGSLRLLCNKEATKLSPIKTSKQPSAEMRFIDKALRYLTL